MKEEDRLEKALQLVGELKGISASQHQYLEERIPRAIHGDEAALAHILLFPFDHRDNETFRELIALIVKR